MRRIIPGPRGRRGPPGPAGGELEPLGGLLVVDKAGGSGTQDGSFTLPQTFKTLAAAIAAAVSGATLLLMPGDYTGEGSQTWADKVLTFWGVGVDAPATALPSLTATGGGAVTVENCQTIDVTCTGNAIAVTRGALFGNLTGATILLLQTSATAGAELTGAVTTDLYTFNKFGAAGGVLTGSMTIQDSLPDPKHLYVRQDAFAYGNGSEQAPFNLLADGVAAAPSLPDVCVLELSAHDYSGEGFIEYTDKHLHVQGQILQNEVGSNGTRGVMLKPTLNTSDDWLEIENLAGSVDYQVFGCHLLNRDAFVESFGTNAPDVYISGAAKTARISCPPGQPIGACILNGGAELAGGELSSFIESRGGVITGSVELTNALIGRSSIQATNFLFVPLFRSAHPVLLTACTFDGGTVFDGAMFVDLDTYARGIDAGVTWPEDTTIVDQHVTLQPFLASVGVGNNNNGNATPAYGTNITGDRFVLAVDANGGTSPVAPVGWSLVDEISVGGIITQAWTRDAPSTGGEIGTIIVLSGGGVPTQAVIYTMRNCVSSASFTESPDAASNTGGPPVSLAGPTVTATGKGRTACCISGTNGAAPATQITGQTGGTWLVKDDFPSGLGMNINLQMAALADAGTITGGTFDSSGDKVNAIGFALIGEVT